VGTIASGIFNRYPANQNRPHACESVGRNAGCSSALHAQWREQEKSQTGEGDSNRTAKAKSVFPRWRPEEGGETLGHMNENAMSGSHARMRFLGRPQSNVAKGHCSRWGGCTERRPKDGASSD
jgi:hypothetical protein